MKTLVICNGHPPSSDLFNQTYRWADYVVAADGGGNIALQLGGTPDVVIGDLDSFDKHNAHSFDIKHDPDQESNDLEKALEEARKQNATQVIVLGATGRHVDQTLKNLSVLKQFNSRFQSLIMRDEYHDIFVLPKSFSIDLPVGTGLSLFPLSGRADGIKTEGLLYPLNDETLENGVRDGSSNQVTAPHVRITYKRGDLLCFIAR
jgi:thiamine pyrophosphokinase